MPYNHDEFLQEQKLDNSDKRLIAEMWFRNEVHENKHARAVIQIEDFLGRIGGIFGIIYALV